jgi:hypothetical protein
VAPRGVGLHRSLPYCFVLRVPCAVCARTRRVRVPVPVRVCAVGQKVLFAVCSLHIFLKSKQQWGGKFLSSLALLLFHPQFQGERSSARSAI